MSVRSAGATKIIKDEASILFAIADVIGTTLGKGDVGNRGRDRG